VQADADVRAAGADERNALEALALEIGRDSGSIALPALLNAQLPAGLPAKNDAVERAISNRPEIASAQADVAAEEASLRVARNAALPALTAQMGYTYGTDTEVNVHGPSANLSLTFPVSGASGAAAIAQSARIDQARARLAAAIQNVTIEVGAAYEMLTADAYAAQAATVARRAAMSEVTATQVGYRNGAVSSLEVLDARRTFAEVAISELAARAAFDEALDVWPLSLGEEP